ncbi:MAG TPA: hypothetical protein VN655_14815 [Pseudolabrys sp.]|jgi:hypothetical protein|nr:hypothetical protein [Pseudolabrys sp.]
MSVASGLLLARCALAAAMLVCTVAAQARDLGQWGEQSPTRQWFESLRMPDTPSASCCGAADGYWADDFELKDGEYIAIVTDTRPDGPLERTHIAPGTRFVIPEGRVTFTPDNPTGHGWIFVTSGTVFCYLPPSGV